MNRLMLCVTGTLWTVLAACDGEIGNTAVNGGSGGEATESGGSGGTENPRPGSATGTVPDAGQATVCPDGANMTVASHVIVHVKWRGSLAVEAGQGELHLWTKAELTDDQGSLTGLVHPCGSIIPPLTKTDVVGGGMIQLQFPDAIWDSANMPVYQVRGRLDGVTVGSKITMEPVASLLGLTMQDPMNDPWPSDASQLATVDHDGDGQPGIETVPRTDSPFTAPPLDLGGVLDENAPRPDQIYLATRTVLSLSGTRDSCSSAKGTVDVSHLDTHVVGCHVRGDGTCTRSQSDFVDMAQPRLSIVSGTFEMVEVPADATCADVRAALP